jgi:hypothetical protein
VSGGGGGGGSCNALLLIMRVMTMPVASDAHRILNRNPVLVYPLWAHRQLCSHPQVMTAGHARTRWSQGTKLSNVVAYLNREVVWLGEMVGVCVTGQTEKYFFKWLPNWNRKVVHILSLSVVRGWVLWLVSKFQQQTFSEK